MHGEQRVEEVREADAVRLGDEPVRGAVAVEAPRAPLLHDFEARFVVAVEDLPGDPARRRAVDQGERVRAGRSAAYQSDAPATSTSEAEIPRASSRHRNAASAAISAGGMVRFCG